MELAGVRTFAGMALAFGHSERALPDAANIRHNRHLLPGLKSAEPRCDRRSARRDAAYPSLGCHVGDLRICRARASRCDILSASRNTSSGIETATSMGAV
jgi:hypothetical protein